VFYLLPVVVGTVLISTQGGYLLAAMSSTAWVIAGHFSDKDLSLPASLWNLVIRTLTFAVVVFLLGALRTALADAAASRRRTEEFLATAAHQLRTPIAGLVASAEALLVEGDPERRTRLTDNLVNSADRIGRLLSSLLRLSRLDDIAAGEHGELDLADLCRSEAESARIRFPGIEFLYVGPDRLALPLSGQPISEALTNLLENAGRHASSVIEVRVEADGRMATVDVIDDGPGLPPGLEERAFDRFEVLDEHGGNGLGLSIARRLIESQHGHLLYVDDVFRVTLPQI
jgi:signal transduction histidine kinase